MDWRMSISVWLRVETACPVSALRVGAPVAVTMIVSASFISCAIADVGASANSAAEQWITDFNSVSLA
jgi:hypothetical protein